MDTVRAAVRRFAALTILLVLLVGAPVALVALAGNPLPPAIPTWDEVASALSRPDVDGSIFLHVAAVAGWIGWLTFTFSVVVELAAALRGMPAPRLRGLGWQQRAAAGLVSAIFVGAAAVPAATAMPILAAEIATTPGSQTAEAQPPVVVDDSSDSATPPVEPPPTDQALEGSSQVTYTVVRGDSLWTIAESQLGDPTRWQEIARLNYGHVQMDGQSLDTTHWISPGWQLRLPEPPEVAVADTGADEAADSYVVQRGDTLWAVADEHLGDPARWPEIASASASIVQPDGERLSDPDLIVPGWTLNIPGAEAEPETATEPEPGDTPPEPPAHDTATETPPAPTPDIAQPDHEQPTETAAPDDTTSHDEPPAAGNVSGVPYIRVLGVVRVDNAAGQLQATARRQLTEIASFIALCHPGTTSDDVKRAIWPGEPQVDERLKQAISRLRRWFGDTDDGQRRPAHIGAGEAFRFDEAVQTDWGAFKEYVAPGLRAAETEALEAALRLVDGVPLTATPGKRPMYRWADKLRTEMIQAITDTAAEYARRSILDGQPRQAYWATELGLKLEPAMETLWRLQLKASYMIDRTRVEEAAEQMHTALEDLGVSPGADTAELVNDLLNRPDSANDVVHA